MLIGLTGTYGCGKSTVAGMFAEAGDLVLDADAIAREVVEPGTPALKEIVETFGTGMLDGEGRLNRRAMADVVFSDAGRRRELEAIIHPPVRQKMEEATAEARRSGRYEHIVLNVPLLYEARQDSTVEKVVVVTISESERFRRLRLRDGATESEVVRRLGAQWSQSYKAGRADAVIDNSGSLEQTSEQVKAIRNKWKGQPADSAK